MTRASDAAIAAKVARWITQPETETSTSAKLGRLLISGQAIRLSEMTESLGVSESLGRLVVRDLRLAGYRVETPHGGATQVVGKTEARRQPATAARRQPATAVSASRPYVHPMIGATLTVRAIVLNGNGLEVMALDQDGAAWQLAILGATLPAG
jgi:hypothetical protein